MTSRSADTGEDAAPGLRHHPLEGIHNFRDLGGYATRFHRPTRYGVVFRSASPVSATTADQRYLASLGINRIFDLRSFRELERDGVADFSAIGIAREHVPVFPDIDASPENVIARYKLYTEDVPTVYLMMLDRGAPSYRRVIEAIADANAAVVYHCSGGKDRAGVLSALILSLAGVERETIVADYTLTSRYLPAPSAERIAQFCGMFGLTREEYLAMHAAAPASMAQTLERLDSLYGSVEAYLRGLGISDETQERARLRLLGEA